MGSSIYLPGKEEEPQRRAGKNSSHDVSRLPLKGQNPFVLLENDSSGVRRNEPRLEAPPTPRLQELLRLQNLASCSLQPPGAQH